jgi:hypothetical protein
LKNIEYYAVGVYQTDELGTQIWLSVSKKEDGSLMINADPYTHEDWFNLPIESSLIHTDHGSFQIALFPYNTRTLHRQLPLLIKVAGSGLLFFFLFLVLFPIWMNRAVHKPLKNVTEVIKASEAENFKTPLDKEITAEWEAAFTPLEILRDANERLIHGFESVQKLVQNAVQSKSYDQWCMTALSELALFCRFDHGVFIVRDAENPFELLGYYGYKRSDAIESWKDLLPEYWLTYFETPRYHTIVMPDEENPLITEECEECKVTRPTLFIPLYEDDILTGIVCMERDEVDPASMIEHNYIRLANDVINAFFQKSISNITPVKIAQEQAAGDEQAPAVPYILRPWADSDDLAQSSDVDRLLQKTVSDLQAGNWEKVIPYLMDGLKNLPEISDVLKRLGEGYYERKQYALSIGFLQLYCEIHPEDEREHRLLIAALVHNHNYSQAEHLLKNLLEKNPNDLTIQKMLRLIYQNIRVLYENYSQESTSLLNTNRTDSSTPPDSPPMDSSPET